MVPLCSPTALYFLNLSLFPLRKIKLFSCTLQTAGPTIESESKLKKKKNSHFNGVLAEPLQFSMLSYSNSHHLLWANNSAIC